MIYSSSGAGTNPLMKTYAGEQYSTTTQRPETPGRRVVHQYPGNFVQSQASGLQGLHGQYSTPSLTSGGNLPLRSYISSSPIATEKLTTLRTATISEGLTGHIKSTEGNMPSVLSSYSNNQIGQKPSSQVIQTYPHGQTGTGIGHFEKASKEDSSRKAEHQYQAQSSSVLAQQTTTQISASQHMDDVFKQMTMANDQIRTLVQESDKLIGVAKEFKKGLEDRTLQYLDLKKEVDQLKEEVRKMKEHPLQSSMKSRVQTEPSQAFTIEERDQLLEIIEQQRLEIERLTSKKKKKKGFGADDHTEETLNSANQLSEGLVNLEDAKMIPEPELTVAIKPKKSRKTFDPTTSHRQEGTGGSLTTSLDQHPTSMIKPKKRTGEQQASSTRKYR